MAGSLRRWMTTVALAAATAAALLATGSGTASAAPAAPSGVMVPAGCSTYQYNTDPNMPIYAGPGSGTGEIGRTVDIGIVNVTQFSGDWRYGNFYWIDSDGYAHRYNTGWIYVGHIHYIRCW